MEARDVQGDVWQQGIGLDVRRLLEPGYEFRPHAEEPHRWWVLRCRHCPLVATMPKRAKMAYVNGVTWLLNHEATHRFASGEWDAEVWGGRERFAAERRKLSPAEKQARYRRRRIGRRP